MGRSGNDAADTPAGAVRCLALSGAGSGARRRCGGLMYSLDRARIPDIRASPKTNDNRRTTDLMTQDSSLAANQTSNVAPVKKRMSTRHRILFFVTAWFIAFMPVMFWWNTWFGRTLSDKQVAEYLRDDKHPRHIQHALVQMGERMSRHDATIAQWYPELVRLAAHPVEEVRNTDAWVLGQDTSGQGFHEALLKMLNDPSPLVRGNTALSLVRYGDAAGREQIISLLKSATIAAPIAGRVADAAKAGTAIHQG